MAREFPKIFQNRLGAKELLIECFLKEGSKPTVLVPLWETLRRRASVKMFVKIFLINSPYHSPDCAFSVTSGVYKHFGNHFHKVCRHSRQSADWRVFKLCLEIQAHLLMLSHKWQRGGASSKELVGIFSEYWWLHGVQAADGEINRARSLRRFLGRVGTPVAIAMCLRIVQPLG